MSVVISDGDDLFLFTRNCWNVYRKKRKGKKYNFQKRKTREAVFSFLLYKTKEQYTVRGRRSTKGISDRNSIIIILFTTHIFLLLWQIIKNCKRRNKVSCPIFNMYIFPKRWLAKHKNRKQQLNITDYRTFSLL